MHHKHNHSDEYKITEVKELPNSEMELAGEIPETAAATFKTEVTEELQKNFNLPGFRKGAVPASLMIEKIGGAALMREVAEHALSHIIPHMLEEKKIHAIAEPKVTLSALPEKGAILFTLRVPIAPKVTLPDYKKIAGKQNAEKETPIEITEQEIRDAITAIEKQIGHGTSEKNFSLTDETVKKLGGFENLADFTEKLKTQMRAEKQPRATEKKRLSILKRLSGATPIELPTVLVSYELGKMRAQFEENLKQMGQTFEAYAKHAKKTREEIEKEWIPDARERVKQEIILHHLALAEKISPAAEEVEREVKHILEHHKNADPARARAYVEMMLTNEQVFQFLEQQ